MIERLQNFVGHLKQHGRAVAINVAADLISSPYKVSPFQGKPAVGHEPIARRLGQSRQPQLLLPQWVKVEVRQQQLQRRRQQPQHCHCLD